MYSNLAMSLHTFPGTVRVGGGAEGSAAQCRKEGSGSSSAQPSLLCRYRLPRYRALRGMTQ